MTVFSILKLLKLPHLGSDKTDVTILPYLHSSAVQSITCGEICLIALESDGEVKNARIVPLFAPVGQI